MTDLLHGDSTPRARRRRGAGENIFQRIADLHQERAPFALATLIHAEESTPRNTGARMVIFPDGTTEGTIGGGALEKLVTEDGVRLLGEGKSERIHYDLGTGKKGVATGMICGGKVEVLIESFSSFSRLFIFGAGHVGRMLAELAEVLGMAYWVIDNREEYTGRELFPGAAGVLHAEFSESFEQLPIDENSFIVIVTYGHQFDGVCLEGALETDARYIVMIGSRKKVRTILDNLGKKGVNVQDERVYAPVGLELGDSSPEEIGISILAEILKIKSGGSGVHMRDTL
jgi:xanthine dehydrogenase accessory factor